MPLDSLFQEENALTPGLTHIHHKRARLYDCHPLPVKRSRIFPQASYGLTGWMCPEDRKILATFLLKVKYLRQIIAKPPSHTTRNHADDLHHNIF